MEQVKRIERIIRKRKRIYDIEKATPIFEIMMLEKAGSNQLLSSTGKGTGFPDVGSTAMMGFYYSFKEAIAAVENNTCDIRETVYDAAFILCRFPGLYSSVGTDQRLYFEWDEFEKRYVQKKEPKWFEHIAY